ncbi:MAG: hypothetical protein AAF587_10765 [Bacteroidota bacterium]
MSTPHLSPAKLRQERLIQAVISVLIVLYFSYIDEGYNDFRWMKNPGDWLFFALYVGVLFGVQFLVARFVLTNYHGRGRIFISFVLGLAGLIGVGMLIGFFVSLF